MINKTIKHFNQIIFRDITSLGGTPLYFLFLLFVLVSKEFVLFWQLFTGMVFATLIVILIRLFYFKNRPRKQEFRNILEKLDASSFPSLHTARIFFLALVMLNFFNDKLLTVILLVLAALVSYSRVYLRKHDFVDLFGGLMLAIVTFYLSGLVF